MKSMGQMIAQLSGLVGTRDTGKWVVTFISSIIDQTDCGKNTARLSDKQIEIIERLWRQYFAG